MDELRVALKAQVHEGCWNLPRDAKHLGIRNSKLQMYYDNTLSDTQGLGGAGGT